MLSHLKNFIKNNSQDIFIIAVVILVALISFGIGRLSAPKTEPIQIMNSEKASVENLVPERGQGTAQGENQEDYEEKVVGSKNSDKYHLPNCPGAKQISEQNKIWFNSIEEAEKAGYSPAGNCPGLK
jgi:hypothetical protein